MSNASAPPTIPPGTVRSEVDEFDGPRTNDLVSGKRYRITMGDKSLDVTIETVREKERDKGWYVEFKNPHTKRKIMLELDKFFDNAYSLDTTWLGGEPV